MSTSGRPARPLRAVVIVSALVGGLVAVPAGQASAEQQPNRATVHRSQWLTTDSRSPHHNTTTGNARVGAWRDEQGKRHTGKSYFTFDLTRFTGMTLFTAVLRLPEVAANDCTKPRATELWLVKPNGPITWAHQPGELVKITGRPTNGDCVYPWFGWDVAEVARQALAEGRTSLTFVARISAEYQGDVAYGRTHDNNPRIEVEFNTPPTTPTELKVEFRDCTTQPVYLPTDRPVVSAMVLDPDTLPGLAARFAFWPVDAPDQRQEVKATVTVTPTSDGPVSIEVAGLDRAGNRSPARSYRYWVRTTAPWVTFPLAELGVPAEFVFNVTQDGATTLHYRINDEPGQTLPIGPDGKARTTLTFTEPRDFGYDITAWTENASGGKSGVRNDSFHVNQVRPRVKADPWSGPVGQTRVITATPTQRDVVSYVYRVNYGDLVSVPAQPDGTLRFEFTPTEAGGYDFEVAGVNSVGVRSGWGETSVVADGAA